MQDQLDGVSKNRSCTKKKKAKKATFLALSGYELTWQHLQD